MKEQLKIISEEFNYLNEERIKIKNKPLKTEEDLENLKAIEELYQQLVKRINDWSKEKNKQTYQEEKTVREKFIENRRKIEEIKHKSQSLQPAISSVYKLYKDAILEQEGFIKTKTVDNRDIRIHPSLIGKYHDLIREQRILSDKLKQEYLKEKEKKQNPQVIQSNNNIKLKESIKKEEQLQLEKKNPKRFVLDRFIIYKGKKYKLPHHSQKELIKALWETEKILLSQQEIFELIDKDIYFQQPNNTIVFNRKNKETSFEKNTFREPDLYKINFDSLNDKWSSILKTAKITNDNNSVSAYKNIDKIININNNSETITKSIIVKENYEEQSKFNNDKKQRSSIIKKVRKPLKNIKKETKAKIAIIAASLVLMITGNYSHANYDVTKKATIEKEITDNISYNGNNNFEKDNSIKKNPSIIKKDNLIYLETTEIPTINPKKEIKLKDNGQAKIKEYLDEIVEDFNNIDNINHKEKTTEAFYINKPKEENNLLIGNTIKLNSTSKIYSDEINAYLDEKGKNGLNPYWGNETPKIYLGGLFEDENGLFKYIYVSDKNANEKQQKLIKSGGRLLSALIAEPQKYNEVYDGKTPLTISQINKCAAGWIKAEDIIKNNSKTGGYFR